MRAVRERNMALVTTRRRDRPHLSQAPHRHLRHCPFKVNSAEHQKMMHGNDERISLETSAGDALPLRRTAVCALKE
jgi:hypothetical protein